MKRMTFTAITFGMMAIITAVAISQSTITAKEPPVGPVVSGQSDEGHERSRHERSLVGVWVTQVTRINCDTGATIAASQIQLTFAKGGTLLETIGPSIVRSPGNGIWKREHGWNEYSFVLRFMRYDAAGSFVGSGVVRAAITLDETGDHSTSTATNDVLDAAGNVIASGCATSVSTRFQ
ncbi:MAG: hypothetical protein ND866_19505 [Pyrinomonadaceae bacterium]|nr:hypothetical protein [Pyrinomonadaceae bacterium]